MEMLVSTDWLASHLNDPDLRIVDVRWYLFDKDKTGQSEYRRGHIPGAVFVDLETALAKHGVSGPGRHPIPDAQVFAEAMSNIGIDAHTHVVAYDDRGGASCARLWWLLLYFGHDQVSLLDGGIAPWIAEGRPLETIEPSVPRKNFVAQPPRQHRVVGKLTVDALRRDPHVHIFDVRVGERYRGEIEPLDPKAGHIPGAKNAPIAGNLRSETDLRFLSPEEIRARFEKLGAHSRDTIVTYCGSGVNACQTIFALTLAGFENVLLYEGSWSDWSRDNNLPVMTGPNP